MRALLDLFTAFLHATLSLVLLFWLYLSLGRGSKGKKIKEGRGESYPKVSVIIPAKNEEGKVGRAVKSVLENGYPGEIEVIVVDDGSEDRTAEEAERAGATVVVRGKGEGKAKAVNRGLERGSGEVVIVLDADTVIENGGILALVRDLEGKDMVCGRMRGRGRGVLAGFQEVEYAFLTEVLMAHGERGLPVPFFFGAVGAYKTEFLRRMGGFPEGTVGEDLDLLLSAKRRGARIGVSDAVAVTQVPESLAALVEQRLRWTLAGVQVFFKHGGGRYPEVLYVYWPVFGLFSTLLSMYYFLRYLPPLPSLLPYVLSWFSFYGIIHTALNIHAWGYPIPAITGLLLSLLNLSLYSLSVKRHWGSPLFLFFVPFYLIFVLGIVNLLFPFYALLNWKEKRFKR